MLFRCGMITSFRQVRKPTMKKRAIATDIARTSVFRNVPRELFVSGCVVVCNATLPRTALICVSCHI